MSSPASEPVLALFDTSTDPPAGRIEREPESGEPTGLLVETAAWELVNPLVPKPDTAARRQALLAAQRHLHWQQRGEQRQALSTLEQSDKANRAVWLELGACGGQPAPNPSQAQP